MREATPVEQLDFRVQGKYRNHDLTLSKRREGNGRQHEGIRGQASNDLGSQLSEHRFVDQKRVQRTHGVDQRSKAEIILIPSHFGTLDPLKIKGTTRSTKL